MLNHVNSLKSLVNVAKVRVKCRAMRDGAIGWATATGSNGVVFVEQKRVHFQAS